MSEASQSAKSVLLVTVGARDLKVLDDIRDMLADDWKKSLVRDFETMPASKLYEHVNDFYNQTLAARTLGEKYREKYLSKLQWSDLQLLYKVLNYSGEATNHRKLGQNISQIWLIATDQQQLGKRDQDSILFAEIIEEWFNKEKNKEGFSHRNTRLGVIKLTNSAVSYTRLYKELYDALILLDKKLPEYDQVYISMAGGTPAMSWAAIQAVSRICVEKLMTVYVEKGSDDLPPMDTGRILTLQSTLSDLRSLLQQYNFGGALELFKAKKILGKLSSSEVEFNEAATKLEHLLSHATYRLLFDLKEAQDALDNYDGDTAEFYAYRPLNDTTTTDYQMRYGIGAIAELYWHVCLDWETGRYADYLARLKTLTDRLELFILELITELPITYDEAQHNAAELQKIGNIDFNNLGGLNKAYAKYVEKTRFATEVDHAALLIRRICQQIRNKITDTNKVLQTAKRWDKDTKSWLDYASVLQSSFQSSLKLRQFISQDISSQPEKIDNVEDLLKFLADSKTLSEVFDKTKPEKDLPMFRLTRLRNSLPPAHSFGSINEDIILEAGRVGNDMRPFHEKIGEKLAVLNCWDTYFKKGEIQIPGKDTSPFENIKIAACKLLDDMEKHI
jgi:hypothetical protein